jgi:hypothetical protein
MPFVQVGTYPTRNFAHWAGRETASVSLPTPLFPQDVSTLATAAKASFASPLAGSTNFLSTRLAIARRGWEVRVDTHCIAAYYYADQTISSTLLEKILGRRTDKLDCRRPVLQGARVVVVGGDRLLELFDTLDTDF